VTRVIAGAARGRRLAVPPAGTRPTSDRVREALFSAVESTLGSWAAAAVADLFAGSGAVGLEALSRGAARAVLVERDRRALDVIRRNVATVSLPGALVVADDVSRTVLAPPPGGALDLVFLDPPYDLDEHAVTAVLRALAEHGWLLEGGLVVVERSARGTAGPWPTGYEPERERRYGETVLRSALWYGRDRSSPPGPAA
jgi:16S rRNA (guanine966-N2)-methyltransferase